MSSIPFNFSRSYDGEVSEVSAPSADPVPLLLLAIYEQLRMMNQRAALEEIRSRVSADEQRVQNRELATGRECRECGAFYFGAHVCGKAIPE